MEHTLNDVLELEEFISQKEKMLSGSEESSETEEFAQAGYEPVRSKYF